MTTYQAAYLSDIRSQILLIENQLISDKGNKELQKALNSYTELKNSVEQGLNCKLVSVSVLDPVKLSVCIEVILGLSRVCNCVFIAGFCHCAVSVKAFKSAVSVVFECSI